MAEVYPRVGGETKHRTMQAIRTPGLSPRGRGNRSRTRSAVDSRRSIPAWAGKPRDRSGTAPAVGVYPRVGGETARSVDRRRTVSGLSPRGRGNPRPPPPPVEPVGSIPAWAGKPGRRLSACCRNRVYPRVGGETRPCCRWHYSMCGLSPRGRGNPVPEALFEALTGSIPAWAGKPLRRLVGKCRERVYPRVGGETACYRG